MSKVVFDHLHSLIKSHGEEKVMRMLHENSAELAQADIPVWKTISIGLLYSPHAYRAALLKNKCRISGVANAILRQTPCMSQEYEAQLVVRSVEELGFSKSTLLREICGRARELDLELLPPEVGPALRLLYRDQPEGECLHLAMAPIPDGKGGWALYTVKKENGSLVLGADIGDSDSQWSPVDKFLFLKVAHPHRMSVR